MLRKILKRKKLFFLLALILLAIAVVAKPYVDHLLLTGRFFPIHKIETLDNPFAVSGWSEGGLILKDGRTIQLPGFSSLPKESAALAEAVSRGIEIGADGRVYALVRIHHWCGNDPVRTHIARIDLAKLLVFLGEGKPRRAAIDEERLPMRQPGGSFSERGWDVSEYSLYQHWIGMSE